MEILTPDRAFFMELDRSLPISNYSRLPHDFNIISLCLHLLYKPLLYVANLLKFSCTENLLIVQILFSLMISLLSMATKFRVKLSMRSLQIKRCLTSFKSFQMILRHSSFIGPVNHKKYRWVKCKYKKSENYFCASQMRHRKISFM